MIYKAKAGIILTEVCGDIFLVSLNETIKVNETFAYCWKMLVIGADEDMLINMIKREYNSENSDDIRFDIHEMINLLLSKELITRC